MKPVTSLNSWGSADSNWLEMDGKFYRLYPGGIYRRGKMQSGLLRRAFNRQMRRRERRKVSPSTARWEHRHGYRGGPTELFPTEIR